MQESTHEPESFGATTSRTNPSSGANSDLEFCESASGADNCLPLPTFIKLLSLAAVPIAAGVADETLYDYLRRF